MVKAFMLCKLITERRMSIRERRSGSRWGSLHAHSSPFWGVLSPMSALIYPWGLLPHNSHLLKPSHLHIITVTTECQHGVWRGHSNHNCHLYALWGPTGKRVLTLPSLNCSPLPLSDCITSLPPFRGYIPYLLVSNSAAGLDSRALVNLSTHDLPLWSKFWSLGGNSGLDPEVRGWHLCCFNLPTVWLHFP